MNDAEWLKTERMRRIVGFVGGYLIEIGAMTLEDLDKGLEEQLRFAAQGKELRLGEVLIQMGKISRAQLERALKLQAQEETQRLRRALVSAKRGAGKKKSKVG